MANKGIHKESQIGFSECLQNELLTQGYKLLTKAIGITKAHLKMVTRVRYDDDSTKYEDNRGDIIKHINFHERDISLFDNTQILEQKHIFESSESDNATSSFTIFKSGS